MKIEIISPAEISVTVDNRKDLLDLLSTTRVPRDSDTFFQAVADLTQKGSVTLPDKACRSSLEAGGGFMRVHIPLGRALYNRHQNTWSDPLQVYWDVIKDVTGSDPFDLDLLPGLWSSRICATNYVEEFRYDAEQKQTVATIVFELFHFQGKKFADDTERQAKALKDGSHRLLLRLLRLDIPQEFLELPNGLYKRNPDYPSRLEDFSRTIDDGKLLLYMANQWLERFGTPGQKEMVKRISAYPKEEWLSDRFHSSKFHIDDFNGSISFEDFQKL